MEKITKKTIDVDHPIFNESIPSKPVREEEFEKIKNYVIKKHINLFKKLAK